MFLAELSVRFAEIVEVCVGLMVDGDAITPSTNHGLLMTFPLVYLEGSLLLPHQLSDASNE